MRRLAHIVVFALIAALICVTTVPLSARSNALESFYVARFFFSDDLQASSDTILDVEPVGNDVRVRLIRLSLTQDYCPTNLVRAVERMERNTTVRKVAGRDVCGFSSGGVDSALKAAASKVGRDNSDSAEETIVARCNGQLKEFDFPYPAEIDRKTLDRQNPGVSHLWDTRYDVWMHSFGKHFSFDAPDQTAQKIMRDMGTALLPELRSGKYQVAYQGSECGGQPCGNYLAYLLRDYDPAAPPYDPRDITLVNASSLPLTKYTKPDYPVIAVRARILSADITIRLFSDPDTGAVTKAEYVSGQKLFSGVAINAANTWRFEPAQAPRQPVEATLHFELRCR